LSLITNIAISGPNNSGKTTICNLLSQELGWEHIKIGEEFRKLTDQYNLDIEDFGSIPDEQLMHIDEMMKQRMRKDTHLIWDGRLSCFLAKERQDIFKILCTADFETRVQRASNRMKLDLYKAKIRINQREREENEVFKRLYQLDDPFMASWFDLTIDTSDCTPEQAVDEILSHIK